MSDDTPTLRLPESLPPTPPMPIPSPPRKPPRPSRAPLIAFVVVAVLVVAASGLLVYILISRGGVIPNAVATTTPPPSTTTVTTPPPPPPPPGQFTSFAAPTTQRCDSHGKGHQSTDLQVSWSTTNAAQVWIAAGTGDAVSAGNEQAPLTGNQDSLPMPIELDCNSRSTTFTMTLVGDDGGHVSKTWTVINDRRG